MAAGQRDVIPAVRTSRRFDLISAALAFVLWAGWAYYVNRGAAGDRSAALISAATQGAGSFAITLILVRSVGWLYHLMPAYPARMVLPGLLTVTGTGTALATAHILVGTADIIRTIVPALSVALAFCLYTTFKIHRAERLSAKRGAVSDFDSTGS